MHYNPEVPIRVETNTSGYAIAAVLTQQSGLEVQHHWHPVAYWSWKMTPKETCYGVGDQEMLVIIGAFKQWWHYLKGALEVITVITDHDNLKRFMMMKMLNRWHTY